MRWQRLACLLVLALSWTAQAHAERVKLLTFEGDRATPLRWRVAQVLRRAGHTVLNVPPPNDPESSAELRSYAAEQRVDVFISAVAREGNDGWELALRLQNPDGKALGKPVTFRANTLGALVKELKGNGQVRLDRAMRGAPPSRAARSVVASTEVSLEGAEQSWDADADDRPPAASAKAKPAQTKARAAQAGPPIAEPEGEPEPETKERVPDRGRAAYLRFAMAGAAVAPPPTAKTKRAPAPKRAAKRAPEKKAAVAQRAPEPPAAPEEIDLDAATSDALEEDPSPSPPREAVAARATPDNSVVAETVLDADADLEPAEGASARAGDEEPEQERRPSRDEEESASAAAVVASVDASLDAVEQTPADNGVDDSDGPDTEQVPVAIAKIQAGLLRRTLSYVDDLYGRLRAPTTNGWVYRADAAFFPFAKPLKSRLALVGSYEGALTGAVVDDRSEQTYDVKFSEVAGGLRYRQPLGAHELGLRASVGHLSSGLDDPQGLSGVPEFSYTYITPSVDVDLRFGDVSLQAELGYRHSVGDFGEAGRAPWFPHMEGYGFDTKLGFEYRFSKQVAFVLSGALRRFVLDMNSVPDDASSGGAEVAAGAVDQYLAGYSGLQLTL